MLDITSGMQVLAGTILGEAEGEPILGKQAVASVAMNRYHSSLHHPRKQFGSGSIASTCLAPMQFSSWNFGSPRRPIMLALDFDRPGPMLSVCIEIARSAMAGTLPDPTHGALFYKRTDLPWPHDWGTVKPALVVIGAHSFYAMVGL
jgi:N-acetylmuramoyl-L-alanine amidase